MIIYGIRVVCTPHVMYVHMIGIRFTYCIHKCGVVIFHASGIYRLIAGALMPTTELEQSERQEKRLRTDSSHSWRAGFDENSPTPPPSPLSTGLRGKDTEEAVGGDDDEKVSGL